ncbi:BDM_1a_G0036030.mRNA.1.CDS.1 [Saccharomyces cerevisiae]|nr:BDM_1a_G0036030.mRNA.1.CDS.1 [Saccharomyces cerevisiae]CAI7231367.1 BDM_1a_G0036030.mRNA.1.CDS.1 [Saccharomyces cerevisiae]
MKISQFGSLAFAPIVLLQLFTVQAQLLTDSNAQDLNTALGQKVQYTFLDTGNSNDQILHLPSTTSSSIITGSLAAANFTGFSSSSSIPKVTSSVITSINYQSSNSTVVTQFTPLPSSSRDETKSSQTTNTISSSTSTGGVDSVKPCLYFVLMLETIAYLFS